MNWQCSNNDECYIGTLFNAQVTIKISRIYQKCFLKENSSFPATCIVSFRIQFHIKLRIKCHIKYCIKFCIQFRIQFRIKFRRNFRMKFGIKFGIKVRIKFTFFYEIWKILIKIIFRRDECPKTFGVQFRVFHGIPFKYFWQNNIA